MQNFYTQFWRYVPSVWVDKEDLSSRAQKAFYERNHSAFLNEYASSNPHEDFAESFTWFIISPSSVLDEKSPVDQKALFFYQYPELVSLRLQILQNLAALLVSSNE